MSDGPNIYNRLVGYILWIDRGIDDPPEQVHIQRGQRIGDKRYKVTLRNIKLYVQELKEKDPTITAVMIDRISRCGRIRWEDDTTED